MKKYLVYIISLLIVVGCGSDDVIDDIIVTKDKLEVSVSRINFQSEKDSQLFSIKANCSWAITCSDSWLTVSPTSGKDNQEITVTVNKNSLASERTATITIKGGNNLTKTVTVVQSKADNASQVPGSNDNIPPES